MKIAVVDSGVKKWTSAIAVDSIVAPVITSPATIAITPTDDVHITLTGGTSFIHIESVGAGAGIQFSRPNTSDAGSMITWQTSGAQKWKAGPLGDASENWILYNTSAAANAIAVNSSTNVTTIASLTLGAALPVASGGTGQTSYTNGQLLIGNTTGNTLAKATLTGTTSQVVVTNGAGSITLSLPQSIATTSDVQFAHIGLGVAVDTNYRMYSRDSSSNYLKIETTGSTSAAGLQCKGTNRTFSFAARQDLDSNGTFNIADETAGAIRMSCDQNGWFGFGGPGLSRIHSIENSATASERGIISEQFLNGTTGGTFIGRKARISGSSRIAITTGDILADFKAQGHDGTSFVDAAKIQIISTGTIGTGRMPSEMVFYTSTDASTSVVTEAARFTAAQKLALAGQVSKYNGITTAGGGVPAIYGQGRFTAQTAAKATVASYTVGAADASFLVWANVLVTTSTTHNFTATVAYTDEGNTARTLTINFQVVGGTIATAIANAGGAVPYHGIPVAIRCKASTTITIATTGTFTTVTYNVEGYIGQVS